MTMLALNTAPFIGMLKMKIQTLRQRISRVIELIAESRMRQVQRELERHGFVTRAKE
jgi:hypothetical protein